MPENVDRNPYIYVSYYLIPEIKREFIMIKWSFHKKDTTIINVYVVNIELQNKLTTLLQLNIKETAIAQPLTQFLNS